MANEKPDYIDRNEAIAALTEFRDDQTVSKYVSVENCMVARGAIERATKVLESLPAADVEPVKRGRWIEYTKVIIPDPYNKWEQAWKCSECGFDDGFVADNYCSNCGVRMVEEVDHAQDKGIYRIFRTKEDMQHHDEEIRHFTRVFTLDHVTVALGRMGFRESKFREFDRVLTEVFQEYMADYSADLKDDKSMEYSRACLDRELKQYTGKFFVPEEERYK